MKAPMEKLVKYVRDTIGDDKALCYGSIVVGGGILLFGLLLYKDIYDSKYVKIPVEMLGNIKEVK